MNDENDSFIPLISKWNLSKEFLKLNYNIRKRNCSFKSFYILSYILAIMYLAVDAGQLSQINPNPNPIIMNFPNLVSKINLSLTPTNLFNIYISPNNTLSNNISNEYLYFDSKFKIIDNIKQIEYLLNNNLNPSGGIFINFTDYNNNKTDIIALSSRYSLPNIINSGSQIMLNYNFKKNIEFNFSGVEFPHPAMASQFELDALTASKVWFCFAAVIFRSILLFYKLGKDKVLFLCQIHRLPDIVLYFNYLLIGFIELFPTNFVVSLFLSYITPSTSGSNFLLVLFVINLFAFALYLMSFTFITIIRTDVGIGVLIAFFFIIEFVNVGLFLFKSSIDIWILKTSMILTPCGGMHGIFHLLTKMKSFYGKFTWDDLNISFGFSLNDIIFYLFINILICLILLILFILCVDRFGGKAPIGWKYLFSLNQWKRLFKENNKNQIEGFNNSIDIKNLNKIYEDNNEQIIALDNLSFSIKNKDVIILIGPNGSGKSTLINSITGTINYDDGEILLNNEKINPDFSELYNGLGFVAQDNILFPDLTVYEHLSFFGKIKGYDNEYLENKINYFLNLLNLSNVSNNIALDLSGGEKRKLCIGIALIKNPTLLILDEPTAGVDIQSKNIIWKAISSLNNTTSLISSHSLEEAEGVSTKIFVMKNGNIAFSGTPAELRERSNCGYLINVTEGNSNNLLELIQQINPNAKLIEKSILIPIDFNIINIIDLIEENKFKYTLHLENLEDVLLRFVEEHEN